MPTALREIRSDYGRVIVGPKELLFREAANIANAAGAGRLQCSVALNADSALLEWCEWCLATDLPLYTRLLTSAHWFVSEENYLPLSDAKSVFGSVSRALFEPLQIPEESLHPWNLALRSEDAAVAFGHEVHQLAQNSRIFDLCFLRFGVEGDATSLAGIEPGSPLIGTDNGLFFAATKRDTKSAKLTIAPAGIRMCERIVVLVLGKEKAAALARVFDGSYDPVAVPPQILRDVAGRVIWLIDDDAASALAADRSA